MDDSVARARALLGCRYRVQGRDPRFGLDCVGVVCTVFGIPARDIPTGYRLRANDLSTVTGALGRHFREIEVSDPGDVILMAPTHDQLHLAVLTDRGLVHADAGLRRVVETPGAPAWPVVGRYRRTETQMD